MGLLDPSSCGGPPTSGETRSRQPPVAALAATEPPSLLVPWLNLLWLQRLPEPLSASTAVHWAKRSYSSIAGRLHLFAGDVTAYLRLRSPLPVVPDAAMTTRCGGWVRGQSPLDMKGAGEYARAASTRRQETAGFPVATSPSLRFSGDYAGISA